jgi:hypothetical protein
LYVPSHPARELDEDLEAAGIRKVTKDGKMDFAALRDSYVTLAAEAGANVKELQTLARHSTPVLTLNVYAKKRDGRLAELAERIGARVLPEQECAISVHRKPVEAKVVSPKLLSDIHLEQNQENGGGGIRTPVPRCFKTSIYVRSGPIGDFASRSAKPQALRSASPVFLTPSARTTDEASPLVDALVRPAGAVRQDGPRYLRSHGIVVVAI